MSCAENWYHLEGPDKSCWTELVHPCRWQNSMMDLSVEWLKLGIWAFVYSWFTHTGIELLAVTMPLGPLTLFWNCIPVLYYWYITTINMLLSHGIASRYLVMPTICAPVCLYVCPSKRPYKIIKRGLLYGHHNSFTAWHWPLIMNSSVG